MESEALSRHHDHVEQKLSTATDDGMDTLPLPAVPIEDFDETGSGVPPIEREKSTPDATLTFPLPHSFKPSMTTGESSPAPRRGSLVRQLPVLPSPSQITAGDDPNDTRRFTFEKPVRMELDLVVRKNSNTDVIKHDSVQQIESSQRISKSQKWENAKEERIMTLGADNSGYLLNGIDLTDSGFKDDGTSMDTYTKQQPIKNDQEIQLRIKETVSNSVHPQNNFEPRFTTESNQVKVGDTNGGGGHLRDHLPSLRLDRSTQVCYEEIKLETGWKRPVGLVDPAEAHVTTQDRQPTVSIHANDVQKPTTSMTTIVPPLQEFLEKLKNKKGASSLYRNVCCRVCGDSLMKLPSGRVPARRSQFQSHLTEMLENTSAGRGSRNSTTVLKDDEDLKGFMHYLDCAIPDDTGSENGSSLFSKKTRRLMHCSEFDDDASRGSGGGDSLRRRYVPRPRGNIEVIVKCVIFICMNNICLNIVMGCFFLQFYYFAIINLKLKQ